MARKVYATYHRREVEIENGKFVTRIVPERVRVLVQAEGYVMVRKPRAMPFVVWGKELEIES